MLKLFEIDQNLTEHNGIEFDRVVWIFNQKL